MEQKIYRQKNTMASASLVLGVLSILAILSIQFIYLSVPLGCMGALFAHLSKGGGYRMPEKAIGGMAVSLFAIVITISLLTLGSFLAIRLFGLETLLDPEALQKAMNDLFDQYNNLLQTGGGAL